MKFFNLLVFTCLILYELNTFECKQGDKAKLVVKRGSEPLDLFGPSHLVQKREKDDSPLSLFSHHIRKRDAREESKRKLRVLV